MSWRFCPFILVLVIPSDPMQPLAAARAAIDAKAYQRESTILQEAITETLNITDSKQCAPALTAIHSYRALALSLLGNRHRRSCGAARLC